MQSPTHLKSWKRRGLQLGLLSGAALAFVGGAEPPPLAAAPRRCALEGECTFKKPRLAIVLDGSTAMNEAFDADSTRWETAVEFVEQVIAFDNGYIAENYILGLMHFGHDPDPAVAGTKIAGDTSGLVDGVKLDVSWYDPNDPDKKYLECDNGDAIVAALDALPAPLGGAPNGIGAWTSGALAFAKSYYLQANADHADEAGKRPAALLVLTTGRWTDAENTLQQSPPEQDPALVASDLWVNYAVPTYVVALGGPGDEVLADGLALAGGTDHSVAPSDLQLMLDTLKAIVDSIGDDIVLPVCTPGIGRVMILLDASSSMLNVDGAHAGPGEASWDLVRDKLAGPDAIFDILLDADTTADQQFYFGLSVFGGQDEEKLLVQYAPCREPNIAWALDPASACEAPGCTDPYAPPPIPWSFKDGSMVEPPGFGSPTFNHMPDCDAGAPMQPLACAGSGSHPDLGLQLVQANAASYRAECLDMGAQFPCNENTAFINVLITDGTYDSTDAQVQAPLQAMHADGIVTHIIGFGDDLDIDQLDKMAAWGSGDLLDPVIAQTPDDLVAAFKTYLKPPTFDPCCTFLDCSTYVDTDGDGDTTTTGDGDDSTTDEGQLGSTSDTDTAATDTDTSSGSADDAGTTAPIDSGAGSTTTACDTASCTGESGQTPTGDVPTGSSAGDATGAPNGGDGSDDGDSSGGPGILPEKSFESCDCNTGDPSPTSALLLLALLGLRRRARG